MRKPRKVAVLVTVLLMVLFAGIVCCEAQAGPPSGKDAVELIQKQIDVGDAQIEKAVAQAQKRAEDPDQVERAKQWLIDYTNGIAERIADLAEKRGVDVECEPMNVTVGNQTFDIDPMRVAGW